MITVITESNYNGCKKMKSSNTTKLITESVNLKSMTDEELYDFFINLGHNSLFLSDYVNEYGIDPDTAYELDYSFWETYLPDELAYKLFDKSYEDLNKSEQDEISSMIEKFNGSDSNNKQIIMDYLDNYGNFYKVTEDDIYNLALTKVDKFAKYMKEEHDFDPDDPTVYGTTRYEDVMDDFVNLLTEYVKDKIFNPYSSDLKDFNMWLDWNSNIVEFEYTLELVEYYNFHKLFEQDAQDIVSQIREEQSLV